MTNIYLHELPASSVSVNTYIPWLEMTSLALISLPIEYALPISSKAPTVLPNLYRVENHRFEVEDSASPTALLSTTKGVYEYVTVMPAPLALSSQNNVAFELVIEEVILS